LQLTETLVAAVGAIAGAVEAGDPFTAGHQRRVAKVACDLARQMGWDEQQVHGLRMAAMVHDIGKLAVPQKILNKPGRLTPQEFERVKVHVEVGYQILKDIPFPWPVAETMRQHHEKLDGSGYPHGLSGDAILASARVLAVSDIVESMACERPYRKALGVEAALEEVESLAAKGKLDGEVVRACARMFREQGYELPRAAEHEWVHAESLQD
jgi:putative nucleotidyltransferase with HDIG domain